MKYKKELFHSILAFFSWYTLYLSKFVTTEIFQFGINILSLIVMLYWIHILNSRYIYLNNVLSVEQIKSRAENKLLTIAIYPLFLYLIILWYANFVYSAYIWGGISLISFFIIFIDLVSLSNIRNSVFVITDELRLSLEISSIYIFFLVVLFSMLMFYSDPIAFVVLTLFTGISLTILEFSHFSSFKFSVQYLIYLFLFVAIVLIAVKFSNLWGLHLVFLIALIFTTFFMLIHMRLKGIKDYHEYILPLIVFLILFIAFIL